MKHLKDSINEVYGTKTDILTGETSINLDRVTDNSYLEDLFLSLIDDAVYTLNKDFGVSLLPKDAAAIVMNAMDKYKNYE